MRIGAFTVVSNRNPASLFDNRSLLPSRADLRPASSHPSDLRDRAQRVPTRPRRPSVALFGALDNLSGGHAFLSASLGTVFRAHGTLSSVHEMLSDGLGTQFKAIGIIFGAHGILYGALGILFSAAETPAQPLNTLNTSALQSI